MSTREARKKFRNDLVTPDVEQQSWGHSPVRSNQISISSAIMIGSSVIHRRTERILLVVVVVILLAIDGSHGQDVAENNIESDGGSDDPTSPSPRIVGGSSVSIGEIPFICSVRQRHQPTAGSSPSWSWTWTHLCGGTIVNENWLLTSAHCVVGTSTDATKDDGLLVVCGLRQTRTVARIELKPDYVDGQRGNDLALILLKKPLVFTGYVQPIPIFDQRILPSSMATIVGYGASSYGKDGWQTSGLEAATVPILSMKACIQRLGPLPMYLSSDTICTDTSEPTGGPPAGTCIGDSGGPVIIGTELHPYNLLAIPSWTVTPCGSGPSMHTLVSAHIDWILSVIIPNLK